MHWDHEPDWRHSSPCLTGVQEKRGHVPAVQKTLRTLDCGGTTPLSLRVSLVPDALEFVHAFCLAPDAAEMVAECRDGGSWKAPSADGPRIGTLNRGLGAPISRSAPSGRATPRRAGTR